MFPTIWMTGLSGAGKTTLATALCEELVEAGRPAVLIDGDMLRAGLSAGLGFSRADRSENVRRAAHACRLLNAAGVVAVAALISPYRQDRAIAREIIGESSFCEVWLSTSLEVCEQRDTKGLYKRARLGNITHFTGISDEYEPPESPHLQLDTGVHSVTECLQLLRAQCSLTLRYP